MSEVETQTPRATRCSKRSSQRNPEHKSPNEEEQMAEEEEMQMTQDQNLTTGVIVEYISEQKLTPPWPMTDQSNEELADHTNAEHTMADNEQESKEQDSKEAEEQTQGTEQTNAELENDEHTSSAPDSDAAKKPGQLPITHTI